MAIAVVAETRLHLNPSRLLPRSFWLVLRSHLCMSTQTGCTANERTALGYMRTAQAFAILGVVIAQLMRLQRSPTPDPSLGFLIISVPLSCTCHIMALLTACLGCYRFFQWQSTMTRGQAISGGFAITSLFAFTFLVSRFTHATAPKLTSNRLCFACSFLSLS